VPPPWRSLLLLAATAGTLLVEDKTLRRQNRFTY
jgi:hypothetical protein